MQPFNTKFVLSREYLSECFDQTLPYGKNAKPNYLFPVFMLSMGAALLYFTEQSGALGGMLLALGLLELIHIRFRRAWWLTRQLWGRNANSNVILTVDDTGIMTQSNNSKTTLVWDDIKHVIETELGLILVTKSGSQQYLSKSIFSVEMISEIVAFKSN